MLIQQIKMYFQTRLISQNCTKKVPIYQYLLYTLHYTKILNVSKSNGIYNEDTWR